MADPVFEPGSLDEAKYMYSIYINGEKALMAGKSYQIGNRTLSRENLNEIIAGRKEWFIRLQALTPGIARRGPRVSRVVIRDD